MWFKASGVKPAFLYHSYFLQTWCMPFREPSEWGGVGGLGECGVYFIVYLKYIDNASAPYVAFRVT